MPVGKAIGKKEIQRLIGLLMLTNKGKANNYNKLTHFRAFNMTLEF
jgi:hypothetical protein